MGSNLHRCRALASDAAELLSLRCGRRLDTLIRLDSDSPAIPDAAERHEGDDHRDGRRDLRLQVEERGERARNEPVDVLKCIFEGQ